MTSSENTLTVIPEKLPSFITAPVIRSDVVKRSFNLMHRNLQQPVGRAWSLHRKGTRAGHRNSSGSWGTGRAKARVPRVNGSGTHRAGQAAVANFCRSGHMFSPILPWRRLHRFVPIKERNLALLSCLSASAVAPLVQSKGHILPEGTSLPLIVKDDVLEKAVIAGRKGSIQLLKEIGLGTELNRCKDSKKMNKGRSKLRNRKYRTCRGPLIIHHFKKSGGKVSSKTIKSVLGGLTGIEVMSAIKLNLLMLAPGGEVGRLIVWSESAFNEVKHMFDAMVDKSKLNNFESNKGLNDNDIKSILENENVKKGFKTEENIISRMVKLSK
eukprot:GAHX01000593.1.p1 GENE.GAHX01000593.1~~GAHX01000593.1.p1  ORF type:complete len:326 (-),score=43.84 GAHX01000593.1:26-1003(-)